MIYQEPPPSHYEQCVRRLDGHADEDEDEYGRYIGDDIIRFDDSYGYCTKGLSDEEIKRLLND